jgi:hypothetical protein
MRSNRRMEKTIKPDRRSLRTSTSSFRNIPTYEPMT